jgi:hypothetical protein
MAQTVLGSVEEISSVGADRKVSLNVLDEALRVVRPTSTGARAATVPACTALTDQPVFWSYDPCSGDSRVIPTGDQAADMAPWWLGGGGSRTTPVGDQAVDTRW